MSGQLAERRRDRLKTWVRTKVRLPDGSSRSSSPPAIPSLPFTPPSEPPPPYELVAFPGPSTADAAIDNIGLALSLVQQVGNIIQTVPWIAPAAALMSEVLKAYKEFKDTNEKRDVLLDNITGLTHDLCGTILRMEVTGHVDLVGRLRVDIATYAGLLEKASQLIKEYDGQGAVVHVAARNEFGSKFSALNEELNSFGGRFRTNRLVDLAIHQSTNTQTLDKVHDMALEEKLREWLSTPDMRQKQLDTQNLRQEGTGLWLLNGDKFIEWQDNPGALWICGPSGAGKSVLSSAVISKLTDDKQLFIALKNASSPPAIAFFYFDFNTKEGRSLDSALRRIVLQLSAQSPHPYRILGNQYTLKSQGQTLPTYQDLLKVLEDLLLELGHTYITLDALDECEDSDHRQLVNFVATLQRWTQTQMLHLLITSQPRRIFTEGFTDITCIELNPHITQEDIRLFVHSELQSLEIWAYNADDVSERVVKKSNGMLVSFSSPGPRFLRLRHIFRFRLASCLLVELSHCTWQDELDKALDNLPNDLFSIYDRFLQAIRPEHFTYAEAALRWLVWSTIPVTLDELAEAVAFDFSDPAQYTYKPGRYEGNQITIPKWFEGLVVVDSSAVSLAHASVQDYILSKQFTDKFCCDLSASISHNLISQTCISYLIHFSTHPPNGDLLPNFPLVEYAEAYWCHHLLSGHDQSVLFPAAMQLLKDGSEQYEALLRIQNNFRPWLASASPLHICCWEGYFEGARALVANGAEINVHTLSAASRRGYTDILRLLLDNGADVNATDEKSGSALQAASEGGYIGIVKLLLENGADVNTMDGPYGCALKAASFKGHTDIVHLLLENGADVDAQGGDYGGPLLAAAYKGHTDIVEVLLDCGADVNAEGELYGSVLQAASAGRHTETVRLLLQAGVDVNAKAGKYGTALQIASRKGGDAEMVHLLVTHGACINAKGGEFGDALQAASAGGHEEIARFLLERGAYVNAKGGEFGGALQAACAGGYEEIAYLLLESGADFNSKGGSYGTVLQAASRGGNMEIVRILLGKGADVNTKGGFYGSALQAACAVGAIEIAKLLLETGADVNTEGGEHGSALQAASAGSHSEIVCLLLEKGADVNSAAGSRGSALQAASEAGHTGILRALIDNGANVNATGGFWGSPLQAACARKYTDIMRILLQKGADVNAIGGFWGSALQAMCTAIATKNPGDGVLLLLEWGADVNAEGGIYGSALQAACMFGSIAVVRILLDHGADVNNKAGKYGSALHIAVAAGSTEIMEILRKKGAIDIEPDVEVEDEEADGDH
ncbi:ankyrin repeat-containing domain protein [Mycena rosella]|uniref:Ankyrin repeat-containing domain protein n=1 Tax=Mycena rosella TaxID=1033263 RepID=A0AAD7GTB3_MYCRO|nr:ankyrin repeat-containing domain protein [Mycena rosella]